MKRAYLIVVEPGDAKHAFGVQVPDLPGCFSAGDTFADALANAQEAVLLHLDDLARRKQEMPLPRSKIKAPKDCVVAAVMVDLNDLGGSERVNITLPKVLLKQIDRAAKRAGESRSGFLVHAALQRAGEAA